MKVMRLGLLGIFIIFLISCNGGSSDGENSTDPTSPSNDQSNLLVNPSFEQGLKEWNSANALIRTADPLPHEGLNYVYGETLEYSVTQDVDLLAAGIMESTIDSGISIAIFGGWQAGWNEQEDKGKISLIFLDETENELERSELPFFFSNHTWVQQSGEAIVPVNTRLIRYRFDGVRAEGSNNDAYLDSAYVRLD